MAVIKILEMKQKRRARDRELLPNALEGARIKVCATGCSHCTAMRENVKKAVEMLGLPGDELECVSDFSRIAKLGVMSTPSLIIDGRLVSSGKVLKVDEIMGLIIDVMHETESKKS
jgi:small redox-active disulfide protein 2